MDKLANHSSLVKNILTEYDDRANSSGLKKYETCLVFDESRGHYLWMTIDWHDSKRINSIHVHIRLKNGKIYIEEDWTEEGIATDLLEQGVPKEDIVLAFHSPDSRQYTEFAIA